MDEEDEIINRYKDKVGFFVVMDYTTPDGIFTAKGVISNVSTDGFVIIIDTKNKNKEWQVHISTIKSASIEPLKNRKEEPHDYKNVY